MLNEGNQIHNFISSSGSGTIINYGSGSDFLTSYGSGSGSTRQKNTVPTVPVPVPQHWNLGQVDPKLDGLLDPNPVLGVPCTIFQSFNGISEKIQDV
jgi:hypothetical protein